MAMGDDWPLVCQPGQPGRNRRPDHARTARPFTQSGMGAKIATSTSAMSCASAKPPNTIHPPSRSTVTAAGIEMVLDAVGDGRRRLALPWFDGHGFGDGFRVLAYPQITPMARVFELVPARRKFVSRSFRLAVCYRCFPHNSASWPRVAAQATSVRGGSYARSASWAGGGGPAAGRLDRGGRRAGDHQVQAALHGRRAGDREQRRGCSIPVQVCGRDRGGGGQTCVDSGPQPRRTGRRSQGLRGRAPPIAARSGRHGHFDRGRIGIGRPARRRRDPRAGRRRAKRLPDQRRHPEPGTAVRRERVRPGREGGAHRFRHPAGLSAHLARRLGHRRRGPRRRRPGIQQCRQQRTRDVHGRDGLGQRGVHHRGTPAGHGRDSLSVVPRPGSQQSRDDRHGAALEPVHAARFSPDGRRAGIANHRGDGARPRAAGAVRRGPS